jgi:ABC-type dipeptide/oligopeptide/nickel transport system permease component
MKKLVGTLASGAVLLTVLQVTSLTHAAPQVVVTDPKTGQPLAKQPEIASSVASSTSPMQNPNQPTLAQLNQPTDSQLSNANQQLLAKNAELQNQVDSLNTQVKVLVNERSGQIFIYGAVTALLSGILGIALGWMVAGRKGRW